MIKLNVASVMVLTRRRLSTSTSTSSGWRRLRTSIRALPLAYGPRPRRPGHRDLPPGAGPPVQRDSRTRNEPR
jgi:hypothetical protein